MSIQQRLIFSFAAILLTFVVSVIVVAAGASTRAVVAVLLVSMAITGGVAWSLMRYLGGKLSVLKQGVVRVGKGDLLHRLDVASRDEFGQVARSFNRLVENLLAANALVQTSHTQLKRELAEAAAYVTSILPPPMRPTRGVSTDWRFLPSSHLGGDAFGYHWLDDDRLAIYLLDVCGHGIGAALLSISVINVLRTQSLPQTDFAEPGTVLTRLNNAFQMDAQNGMYFTLWYGVYDRRNRRITYASGGHPPAVLMADDKMVDVKSVLLDERGLPISSFPDVEYESSTVPVEGPTRLYVFSDGIYEITRPDGTTMQLADFLELLRWPVAAGTSRLDQAIGAARRIGGDLKQFDDDVSLVEIVLS